MTAKQLQDERELRLEKLDKYFRDRAQQEFPRDAFVSPQTVMDFRGDAVVFTCPYNETERSLTDSPDLDLCWTHMKRAVVGQVTASMFGQILEIMICPTFFEQDLLPAQLRHELELTLDSHNPHRDTWINDSGA